MIPVNFKQANALLKKPENMAADECADLPVFKDEKQMISKWELSPEEMDRVKENGFIYVIIVGEIHPPILPLAVNEGELFVEVLPS